VAPDRSHSDRIDRLYRQHGPALLLFAKALTGDPSRAQDAVHQVFLNRLERGDLHHVADVKAYLFRCIRNAVLI
jgi:DNA-directed RNA polymerase specialized sigma24 family protein